MIGGGPSGAWSALVLAGLLKVGWAVGLRCTDGFSSLCPSLGTAALMVKSFSVLSYAIRLIPIGTAYAVWTGIGPVGAALLGILIFYAPTNLFPLWLTCMIGVDRIRVRPDRHAPLPRATSNAVATRSTTDASFI